MVTLTTNDDPAAEPQIAHGIRSAVPGTPITLRYQYVSELSAEDLEQLIALFTRAFNGGPSWFHLGVAPEDYLRWKAGPDRGAPTRIELTEDESGIVGFRMTMWRRFLLKGRPVMVSEGVDATIDPNLQGRRITSERADFSSRHGMRGQACFGIGYAMHPTSRVRRGVPGEGLVSGESIDTLVRPLSARRLLARLRERGAPSEGAGGGPSRTRAAMESERRRWHSAVAPERLALAARVGWSLLRPRRSPPARWQIKTVERFDERVTACFEAASRGFDLIQVRDEAYLNWRFCDRRGGEFVVRVIEDGESVLGYAAIRADASGAVLADLVAVPEHPEVAEALIADAAVVAAERGAPVVSARVAQHHPHRQLFAAAGFVRNPLPLTLNFAPVDCDEESLRWLSDSGIRLHIMTADTDHV